MQLTNLNAISPVDGRYRSKLEILSAYFSESAFIRYKIRVEVEYFIALLETGIRKEPLTLDEKQNLRSLYEDYSEDDGKRVKEIEAVTNHDVKAVEYFLKESIEAKIPSLQAYTEFVHFGLTSQDINNTSIPLMLKDALQQVYLPKLESLQDQLDAYCNAWKGIPMLAHTHGQPASPTTLAKELRVFHARLNKQMDLLEKVTFPAKFGGATGNMNAHRVAYPATDWQAFAKNFVENILGLERTSPTTQIDHYDGLALIFDNIRRINTLLTDLCVDAWLYISMEYFRQKTVANEVGSSAMPHKVNPIDFENAEGNFGVSTALLEFFSRKLPVSRLQRDLTDSTILRNIGPAVAHSYLALLSLEKGLGKLEVNKDKIAGDLDRNWAVVAEAIQTILRRERYPQPYEKLKELTRGKTHIDRDVICEFINHLDVSDDIKKELLQISPQSYHGFAE